MKQKTKICSKCGLKVPKDIDLTRGTFCGGLSCVSLKCQACGKVIARKEKMARARRLCGGSVCASDSLRKIPPRQAPSRQKIS
jgi:hypothetical protein